MLINLQQSIRRHKLRITGVVHVGAHYGEEYFTYLRFAKGPVIFIEPCQKQFSVLKEKAKTWANVTLFNVACGSDYQRRDMYVEQRNNGQSNSLLKPARHLDHYPDIQFTEKETVTVVPLDSLEFDRSKFNMLAMDVQGFEGEVLRGATETLKAIQYVYTEVNTQDLYEGCTKVEELDAFLKPFGFRRVETKMTGQGWGDAIFTKK